MTIIYSEREWREIVDRAQKENWTEEREAMYRDLDARPSGGGRYRAYLHRDLGEIRARKKRAFLGSDFAKLGVTFEEYFSGADISEKLLMRSKEQIEEEQRRSKEMDSQLWDAMVTAQLGG